MSACLSRTATSSGEHVPVRITRSATPSSSARRPSSSWEGPGPTSTSLTGRPDRWGMASTSVICRFSGLRRATQMMIFSPGALGIGESAARALR